MEKHNILSIIGEEIRIAIAPKHSSQLNKLNEANLKKGDLVGVDDEIGVVNKVKGRVAYIKLPSSPGSFHPIEALRAKYKGKFKGKDLYIAEGKVNEAEDYKYKKYVTKAFNEISDAMFNFRHSMGIKQLTNKDMKLKKRLELMQAEIFSLRRDMKSKGLTEGIDSDIQNAKIGAKASGGGYSPFTKIKNNSWKNIKTGRLVHDKELVNRLGGFDDFIIESKLTEALARGLKPLLTIGSKITKKVGEDALVKLSDKFDRIDDEYAGDIASHLDMAIELMQDGYPGAATKKLKQFNKSCKDVLKGKSVKSAFEGVNEAKKINESMIGIKTKANFKPLQLKGALERAKIQGFQMNRLSVTLTALKLDKKYYKEAMKIIDGLGLAVMMAKEVNEAMDLNDPILIAVRARKTMLAKAKSAPKTKKISMAQYYKLMDTEIDLIGDLKNAYKEYEQLDSDMNAEAGQKGKDWTDADANRYGGDLDKLQTKIENLAKLKLAVKKQIMNYRVN